MKKYEFYHNKFHFIRIDKKAARNAYNNGLTVLLCPVNLKPGGPWHPEISFRKNPDFTPCYENDPENDFEFHVNCFELYNCINTETGFYAAYYIPIVWVDRFNGEATYRNDRNAVMQYDYNFL